MVANLADVCRVDVIGARNDTDLLVNAYQFQKLTSSSEADADVLDDFIEIMEDIYTYLKVISTVITVWKRISVFNITKQEIVGEQSFSPEIEGTMGNDANAGQVCAVVNFPTNVARVTMRKYWGPVGEAGLDSDGLLNATVSSAIASAADLLINPYEASNAIWKHGYLSPKVGAWKASTTANWSTVPGTLRSRKAGVGV